MRNHIATLVSLRLGIAMIHLNSFNAHKLLIALVDISMIYSEVRETEQGISEELHPSSERKQAPHYK